jgi:transposase
VVDLATGEIRQAHIFVAVLGASSYASGRAAGYTYAEAQWAQDLPNWIGGHVRALAFFGGVPEIIVPDNTTTGVTHPSRYEPDLNPTYQDLAARPSRARKHYEAVVIPARVRKPRDKAKVEVGIQVVERWIPRTGPRAGWPVCGTALSSVWSSSIGPSTNCWKISTIG